MLTGEKMLPKEPPPCQEEGHTRPRRRPVRRWLISGEEKKKRKSPPGRQAERQ